MSDHGQSRVRKKMGLGRGLDALLGEVSLERSAGRVASGGAMERRSSR